MNPAFVLWLKNRSINVIIYGAVILGIGFALYKLFLAPSVTNRSLYTAPSTTNSSVGTWTPSPFSCATIKVSK